MLQRFTEMRDPIHNSGPGQIAFGAKSILLCVDITVIMTGHHGKSQDLARSRPACSPCVFSHFMHHIFLSPASQNVRELEVLYEHQDHI